MERLKICVSDRCFFPKSAFTGCGRTVELAQSLGYETVELHPTWAVGLEVILKGRLTCQPGDISSFHISWREDAQNYWQGSWWGKVTYPAYNIFPPEPLGTWVLQKLQEKYKKPVVIHWRQDFGRYKLALLELHGPLGMDGKQVIKALEEKQITGIVIDTDKFWGWLKASEEEKERILPRLFPYVGEVHFRFGHQEDFDIFSGRTKTDSAQLMEKLVRMNYQGRVVVEMGWPDRGSIEILHREGLEKVHRGIIAWLKGL